MVSCSYCMWVIYLQKLDVKIWGNLKSTVINASEDMGLIGLALSKDLSWVIYLKSH